MFSLSINQALDVWKDLEDAYNGESQYAGDTTEIYAYRLIPYSSAWGDTAGILEDEHRRLCKVAAENLTALLRKFEEVRKVKITVEGDPYNATQDMRPFSHRVHVTVIRDEDE